MTIYNKAAMTLAALVLTASSLSALPAQAANDTSAKAVQQNKGQEKKQVSLRILGTSDLHTNFVNYDYYQDKISNSLGLAKTGLLIEQARKESQNTLLFDNGDLIQGTPLGSYSANVDPLEEGEK